MPEPVKFEIRHHDVGDYVRCLILSDGKVCGTNLLLRAVDFSAFRAACPGLAFVEDERREVGKR